MVKNNSRKRKLPTDSGSTNLEIGDVIEIKDLDMPKNIGVTIKDGIRYLSPYWTTYTTRAKGRWLNKKLVDVFTKEFISTNANYAKIAVKSGRMFVNGERLTNLDYVIKDGDKIVHVSHRHEHPILSQDIEIIENNENYCVVNKPPSMPVHPCGQYRIHSILGQLNVRENITGLRTLYRLDRTTSGLLIFAKNYESDLEFKNLMVNRSVKKEYLTLVEGHFPDGEIVCEQPIGSLVVTMGIQCVRPDGKTAKSKFKREWFDGKHSLIRCFIESGRTHQIRVHLQYLGFPICNDQLYNTLDWGVNKGKDANYGKEYDVLCKDISNAHRASLWHEKPNSEYETNMKNWAENELPTTFHIENCEDFSKLPDFDPFCLNCNVVRKKIPMEHFQLFLHCFKYETDKFIYQTEMPEWAIRKINFLRLKIVIIYKI
uniref:Pseudouridine synthase n=1 Tax=Rhabditophanes sp. KR3021 TaxID=114890 RepID=A0AC35TPF8_9BILA